MACSVGSGPADRRRRPTGAKEPVQRIFARQCAILDELVTGGAGPGHDAKAAKAAEQNSSPADRGPPARVSRRPGQAAGLARAGEHDLPRPPPGLHYASAVAGCPGWRLSPPSPCYGHPARRRMRGLSGRLAVKCQRTWPPVPWLRPWPAGQWLGRSSAGVPEDPYPARVQVVRVRDHAAVRARHHLHRRPERLGQVERRRRVLLGHGRAGRQAAARRQDGGRRLRRHRRPPGPRAAPRSR